MALTDKNACPTSPPKNSRAGGAGPSACQPLNFGPRSDGAFDDAQTQLMLGIGKWLDVNGEAIYGTRRWTRFGEGPAIDNKPAYTGADIRFTTTGDTLYAILMAWPGEKAVITSLAGGRNLKGKINKVELLGHKGDLAFTGDAQGLAVAMPAAQPCEHAFALKITGLKLKQQATE